MLYNYCSVKKGLTGPQVKEKHTLEFFYITFFRVKD